MAAPFSLALDPQFGAAAQARLAGAPNKPAATPAEKARAQANEFETFFVSSMFQHMFTEIGGEGPLGNGTGVGVWRSFLTEEYAKTFVKAGGVGLSDQVYKSLLAQQEARAQPQPMTRGPS